MIKFKQIFFLLIAAIAVAGCSSSIEMNNNGDSSMNKDGEVSLKGAKWKLAGRVNTETGDLKVLEPEVCEECYTLTFDTDSTAIAHSINSRLKLNLSKFYTPSEPQNYMLMCEKYDKDGIDYCDIDDFYRAIIYYTTYTITSDEIKLFYQGDYYYLLFKPLK